MHRVATIACALAGCGRSAAIPPDAANLTVRFEIDVVSLDPSITSVLADGAELPFVTLRPRGYEAQYVQLFPSYDSAVASGPIAFSFRVGAQDTLDEIWQFGSCAKYANPTIEPPQDVSSEVVVYSQYLLSTTSLPVQIDCTDRASDITEDITP